MLSCLLLMSTCDKDSVMTILLLLPPPLPRAPPCWAFTLLLMSLQPFNFPPGLAELPTSMLCNGGRRAQNLPSQFLFAWFRIQRCIQIYKISCRGISHASNACLLEPLKSDIPRVRPVRKYGTTNPSIFFSANIIHNNLETGQSPPFSPRCFVVWIQFQLQLIQPHRVARPFHWPTAITIAGIWGVILWVSPSSSSPSSFCLTSSPPRSGRRGVVLLAQSEKIKKEKKKNNEKKYK